MEGISNVDKLYTIHRLDRLTSGLVILGKTSSVAQSYCKSIMNRSCRKIYLARVAGKFPLKYRHSKKLTSKQVLQSGIPLHGEWKEEIPLSEDENSAQKHHIGTNLKEKATSHPACRLRKQYALACWIKDKNGKPVFEDEQDNGANILEQVFQCRHRYVYIFFLF
jgi:23S rRNA-/tRNA-specific pseudouridylate synthase